MATRQTFLVAMGALTLGIAATPAHAAGPAPVVEPVTDQGSGIGSAKKEKCYGIVKSGKNDCASAEGSHACAGYSKYDGSGAEWILLPAGTCSRIVGGAEAPVVVEKETRGDS